MIDCIIGARPQLVGDYYPPVRMMGIMDLIEKTVLPEDCRRYRFTEYLTEWETLLFEEERDR